MSERKSNVEVLEQNKWLTVVRIVVAMENKLNLKDFAAIDEKINQLGAMECCEAWTKGKFGNSDIGLEIAAVHGALLKANGTIK